jgi:fructose-bisphosphate aldolase class II
MTLVTGKELLLAAERGSFAVPGFNVSNIELALGVLDAAQALRAGVLLQLNAGNFEHFGGLEVAVATARALAAHVPVPVGVHLDHGGSIELVRAAIRAGCTSLMFDGSTYPLERNLRETQEAGAAALGAGLALEGELGHVGGREPGVATSEAVLTEPDSARRFVEATRVDALAVSVGTAHGMAGDVNLDLVAALREATRGLPLVLHGGSGVRTAQLREAVRAGIRKVNISTEIHTAFARALSAGVDADPRPALRRARAAVADAAAARIEVLGAPHTA